MPKVKLRLLGDLLTDRSVDALRQTLGGRLTAPPEGATRPGDWVTLDDGLPAGQTRVVLAVDPTHAHVSLGDGRVRKVLHAKVSRTDTADEKIIELSRKVSAFADLSVETRVTYRDANGAVAEGVLLERCPFGGLVLREDQVVVAVGFMRLV